MADDTRTLDELLALLGPVGRRLVDRPDFVNEEERRALALDLVREREEGRRLYWREEIASSVDCFGCTPDSSLREFLNALEMTGHPRIDGGVYLEPPKAVIGAGHTRFEEDKDRTIPTVLAPTKPFSAYIASPSSTGSRTPQLASVEPNLLSWFEADFADSLNALFTRVGRQDVLDRSLFDLIAYLPDAIRPKALTALFLSCYGLSSHRSWHSNRLFDEYDHATPKLMQLIAFLLDIPLTDPDTLSSSVPDPPTSPAEQLAQSVFGRSWSCGGQVSLTIVTLLEFSELKANQLLDFVRQVSGRGGSSTGDTVLFDFTEDNVAVGWTEEDDVVYANGSQALLAMSQRPIETDRARDRYSTMIFSRTSVVVAVYLPLFTPPYRAPAPGETVAEWAQSSLPIFSPVLPNLAPKLYRAFLTPILEEPFPQDPPAYVRSMSARVLASDKYRPTLDKLAEKGLFLFGDPRLHEATSGDDASVMGDAVEYGGGKKATTATQVSMEQAFEELRQASKLRVRWPGAPADDKFIRSHNSLSAVSSRESYDELATITIPTSALPPSLLATIPPFNPSDFDIGAALLTAEAAASRSARDPADLPPVFAHPARLKQEGNLAVYRATYEGVELVLKTHNVEDALEREACMYERLEEAMGEEGVLGSERITPIVVGRFYSTTDAQDMIVMEYGGEVMSRWIEKWTLEQRQQALRLLERLHRAGLSHNNVHGQNFVLSPDGTVRLIDLEHAQIHTCGGECGELEWFRKMCRDSVKSQS
ncbi:hypothetical protein NBRC10512_003402 [Rhodotorula toruloides]|uniref:RHTO0S14e02652g1_1 n=2 Tax=Rhodotorula toruloides TaxID=5286 RepID=A0A061BBQ3_RHOTO|nr:protein kinase-like domain containing protein [Rhodotorula toruloides NP11]EMS24824.1 protein kinase-like domain containing protein [Rhodotorula toruloides NP11]CDR47371.1 RHTO0S14e02652g1_1 [Rhodotorula toruloides]